MPHAQIIISHSIGDRQASFTGSSVSSRAAARVEVTK